jgi:hypothetical protein
VAAKKKVNKTQLILNTMKKHPTATPMEIAEKLKAYKVSAAYVSNIKSTNKAGAKRGAQKGRGRRGRRGASAGGDSVSVASLVKAKKLADELGGVERAKTLLDALSKLTA